MLKIIVRADKCKLNVKDPIFYMPIGGMTLPLTIDFYNCLPVDDIIVNPEFTSQYFDKLILDSNYTVKTIVT